MSENDILHLTSPIANPLIFGQISDSIECHLTCLIEGIHEAGSSNTETELDRTISLIADCQALGMLLMNHYDKLRFSRELMNESTKLTDIDKSFDDFFIPENDS